MYLAIKNLITSNNYIHLYKSTLRLLLHIIVYIPKIIASNVYDVKGHVLLITIRALVSINISYDSDAKIVAGYYKGLNKYSSALDLCFCNFYN